MNGASLPETCIGHRFNDQQLLTRALTHRSAGNDNNERLEYLGDAVLGFIIAEALFERFPEASEGQLTRLRASLVKRDTLAGLAKQAQLGNHVVLGSGELKSGGWRRDSILANATEAVIGAVYLDAGMDACRRCVLDLYNDLLNAASPAKASKDAKTQLQEYLQARHLPLPSYRIVAESGEAHAREFTVECTISAISAAIEARGKSKQAAEQLAAEQALQQLQGAEQ